MKKSLAKISDTGENKFISLLKFALFVFTKPGIRLLKKTAKKSLQKSGVIRQHKLQYNEWIKTKTASALIKKDFEENIKALSLQPKISITIPVYDQKNITLSKAIGSVINQSYSNWELLITAISSGQFSHSDDRIRFISTENKNLASCINSLLSVSTGAYILFLMPDDTITPNCLFEVVKHINSDPSDMLIYTDEDTIVEDGTYATPYFKPGWSPDTLLSRNYIGNTIIAKKELTSLVNGCREGFETNCFYDFLLRASEVTNNIGHIPKVLFHCASKKFTPADNFTAKKALNEAMIRRSTPATITEVPETTGCYYLNYAIKQTDLVSIIIPTKDNTALLKSTIDSILQKTSYPNYEILVLNNNSSSEDFFALIKDYTEKHAGIIRCIDANFSFNFAKLINHGVAESNGKYILMCNNDVEVIHNDWITQMISYAQHNRTGAVGVKLLYPDNTIQHAGIVLGIDGASGHVFANSPANDNGYFYNLKATTNYAAVTAACLMCRKEVYTEVNGMDETLEVEYNDIDLCLRLLEKGYYNLYLPSVQLHHYESATRGHPFRSIKSYKQHEKDLRIFKAKWQPLIDNDPFYNANLSLENTDFRYRF